MAPFTYTISLPVAMMGYEQAGLCRLTADTAEAQLAEQANALTENLIEAAASFSMRGGPGSTSV